MYPPVKEFSVLYFRSLLELRGGLQDKKYDDNQFITRLLRVMLRKFEQLLADSLSEVTYTESQQRGQLINVCVHFSKMSFVRRQR